MDSTISILINRAENEIFLASAMKILSEEEKIRILMQVPPNMTFYSAAISHSYYSIFYSAKAILLTKGIITTSPDAHKKTFDQFKQNFVDTGILDVKLLAIYKKIVVRADELLGIFREEKQKRGDFTYKTIPQANQEPAEDSVKNARIFVSNIKKVIELIK